MIIGVLSEQGGSILNLARSGQATRFVDQYLGRYAARFDRVYYFSYADEAPPLPEGCVVVRNRRRWHRWLYAFALPFVERRRFRQCDLLRVMQMTGEVPAVIAKMVYGIPFAATYGYDYARHAEVDGAGSVRSRLFRWRTALAVRFADLVIVTNPAIRGRVEALADPRRVVFIPNGVDTSRFTPGPVRPVADPAVLLAVGRLSPQKNLPLLLRAAATLRRPVSIRLVGDGPEADRLRALASSLGVDLDVAGVIAHEQLPDALRACDVFVMSSHREGHPKALLEAMACGCVCVGTNVEGIREVLTDGDNGLLAEPDVEALAAALERALEDEALRRTVGRRARATIVERYDIDATLRAEIDALQRLGGAA